MSSNDPVHRLEPGYRIDVDTDARLISIALEGFWTLAILPRYTADILAAHRAFDAKVRGVRPDVLVDLRRHPLQDQSVVAELAAFTDSMRHRAGRLAIIAQSVLHKMQVQRVHGDRPVGIFLDEDEARAWLASTRADTGQPAAPQPPAPQPPAPTRS